MSLDVDRIRVYLASLGVNNAREARERLRADPEGAAPPLASIPKCFQRRSRRRVFSTCHLLRLVFSRTIRRQPTPRSSSSEELLPCRVLRSRRTRPVN